MRSRQYSTGVTREGSFKDFCDGQNPLLGSTQEKSDFDPEGDGVITTKTESGQESELRECGRFLSIKFEIKRDVLVGIVERSILFMLKAPQLILQKYRKVR